MKYTRELTLDLNPASKIQTVHVKQCDANSDVFTVKIVRDGNPVSIGSTQTVNFRYTKPSGYGGIYTCDVNDDGTATLVLSALSTSEEGMTLADISVEEDGEILSTTSFWLMVSRSGVPTNIGGSNEYAELVQTIADAKKLISELDNYAITFTDDGDGNVSITSGK